MGQSKIEVFRRILGDEETAQKANDAFENHYAAAVRGGAVAAVPGAEETITALRQAGVRVCLATGFSPATRDAIIDKLVWGGLIDLALSPADAGFWGFEGRGRPWPDLPLIALLKLRGGAVSELAVVGDTTSDIESGLRAGAAIVAGVLTGASSRADLEQAGAPLILDTIADILPHVTGLPGGGDKHRLGGRGPRCRILARQVGIWLAKTDGRLPACGGQASVSGQLESRTRPLAGRLARWLGCALSDVPPLLSGEAERHNRGQGHDESAGRSEAGRSTAAGRNPGRSPAGRRIGGLGELRAQRPARCRGRNPPADPGGRG